MVQMIIVLLFVSIDQSDALMSFPNQSNPLLLSLVNQSNLSMLTLNQSILSMLTLNQSDSMTFHPSLSIWKTMVGSVLLKLQMINKEDRIKFTDNNYPIFVLLQIVEPQHSNFSLQLFHNPFSR